MIRGGKKRKRKKKRRNGKKRKNGRERRKREVDITLPQILVVKGGKENEILKKKLKNTRREDDIPPLLASDNMDFKYDNPNDTPGVNELFLIMYFLQKLWTRC